MGSHVKFWSIGETLHWLWGYQSLEWKQHLLGSWEYMLSLTAWILQLPSFHAHATVWALPTRAYGPFSLGALSLLLMGIFLLSSRLEHAHSSGLHVRMTLPNPTEGRLLVGILSSLPDLTAEQFHIRIDVQNPLWGMHFRETRKWLRMTDMGGERIRVWGNRMFSLGLGYRVETFLEFTISDFMQSHCSGACFPPKIFYIPQIPAPLHIRLNVAAYDKLPSLSAWKVRKHYLLSPQLCRQDLATKPAMRGVVHEWKLCESNSIGQRQGD